MSYSTTMWSAFADELGSINGFDKEAGWFGKVVGVAEREAPQTLSKILPGTFARLSPEAQAAARAAGRYTEPAAAAVKPLAAAKPASAIPGSWTAGLQRATPAQAAEAHARAMARAGDVGAAHVPSIPGRKIEYRL